MSKKRSDKKIAFLEPSFKDILVCKDKDSRPYMEIFAQEPENISQQGLGILFGILEINDNSEDSSYIVNYLISIIKKEYFFNPKRGPVESFEAALHKTNLALAKLAEHGQVSWIGKLNAVCAVVEKNSIHLAATGTASAFLVRAKSLVNISESQDSEENSNPLKTFQEVISGRLENDDKVIITTESLFNIFSLEELKRSAIKFSREEFTRFLHTALVNELDRAAVLVIDMKEKEEESPEETPIHIQKINAFSQQAFSKKSKSPDPVPVQKERKELIAELKKELEKSQGGFVDEKTGHIYIKDDEYTTKEPAIGENYIKNMYQKISDSGRGLAQSTKERALEGISSLSARGTKLKSGLSGKDQAIIQEDITTEEMPKIPRKSIGKKLSPVGYKLKAIFSSSVFYAKSFYLRRLIPFFGRIAAGIKNAIIHFSSWLRFKYRNYQTKKATGLLKVKTEGSPPHPYTDYVSSLEASSPTREEKRRWFQQLSGNAAVSNDPAPIIARPIDVSPVNPPVEESIGAKIIPSFSRLKKISARLDNKKKTLAFLAILLLIIGPYFILKAVNNKVAPPKDMEAVIPTQETVPLAGEKNVIIVDKLDPVFSGENIKKTINVNGKIWSVGEKTLDLPEENKSYDIAPEFQNPDLTFEMDDLNLIILVKNRQVTAFSASARKWQANSISFPENSSLIAGRSYLTYAYFLDAKNNQLYRYPRASGGFGDKINWLKGAVDFSKANDMAVNDNIYVTDGKNILKFFAGKKQDFTVESTATPISISKLYTKSDSANLYILDRDNKRVIKLGSDGNIIAQYYNPKFGDILDFSVDEVNQKIYISGSKTIESFNM